MITLHHNDNDGRCAAAIVKCELNNIWEGVPSNENFYEYNHGNKFPNITDEELMKHRTVFIVDLAFNEELYNFTKRVVISGRKLVYIDHHKSGREYYEKLVEDGTIDPEYIKDKVAIFFREDISATMLCWIYACMHEDERSHPMDVPFDLSSDMTQIGFYIGDIKQRVIAIPNVVRLINDTDIWANQFKESQAFASGFALEQDRGPCEKVWQELLYENGGSVIVKYINNGEIINSYQRNINKRVLHNAFEVEIDGIKTLALNTTYGNSLIFGEKYGEYPMVCKFSYDGSIKKWRYTFYSHEQYKDTVDCSEIAKKYFNGGGHRGAAGGTLNYNYFILDTEFQEKH
jgi:oligoribonuclease NrnB/cAMP/cGMP phosphodiesterase (DHH superfamily)